MNKLIIKLFSICLLGFGLVINQAHANQDNNDDSAYKHCGGYARTGFIETDVENDSRTTAVAIGGEFGCGFSLTENISIDLGISSSIDPGVNDSNNDKVHGDFFDADKDSYAILGEAVLHANLGDVDAHLGRQNFDSPHMDSDDLRIVPNRFEAYQLNYALKENTNLGFAYVRKMSGWGNGADQSDFVDIGRALGSNEGDAYVVWGSYEEVGLSVQLWDYVIEDIENIFYAEAVYGADLNDDFSWEIGLQYDQGRDIGSSKSGNVDADTWGVTGALTYKMITISAAHNRNHGGSGALASLGGGPFFTSMEDQTLDAVSGSDSRSSTVGIEVNPLEGLSVGFIASNFQASNKSTYHVQENNFFVSYEWNDTVTLEAIYADLDDKNSVNDTDQLRAILTYNFEGPF